MLWCVGLEINAALHSELWAQWEALEGLPPERPIHLTTGPAAFD
jgi:hypothetical protein